MTAQAVLDWTIPIYLAATAIVAGLLARDTRTHRHDREGDCPVKIQMLAMHRREDYPGQYGPEILAVVDQWTLDENPEWWDEEIARLKRSVGGEAGAWAVVTATLNDDDLMAALYPHNEVPLDVTQADQ